MPDAERRVNSCTWLQAREGFTYAGLPLGQVNEQNLLAENKLALKIVKLLISKSKWIFKKKCMTRKLQNDGHSRGSCSFSELSNLQIFPSSLLSFSLITVKKACQTENEESNPWSRNSFTEDVRNTQKEQF